MKKVIFFVIFAALQNFAFAKDISLLSKETEYVEIEVTVDESINAMRNARNYVLKQIKQPLDEIREAQKNKETSKSHLGASFKTIWASDTYLSIIGGYSFASGGMAHPVSTEISQIFDLKNNRPVALKEILSGLENEKGFSETLMKYIISDVARQKILREREEEKNLDKKVTRNDVKEWILKDSFLHNKTTAEMFKNFVFLTEDENPNVIKTPRRKPVKFIHFIYSHYDIAAYVEGGYSVSVPISLFKDKIKPEWKQFFAL